jgi:opacity protein-like surface antigen
MSKSRIVIALLGVTMATASSQQIPKFDLFGGYSYGHISTGDFDKPHANLNGWDVSATYNLNRWFGIVAEGSGLYGSKQISSATTIIFVCSQAPCPPSINVPAINLSQKIHTYSLGPRFYYRNHTRYTPFARALFGGGYISDTTSTGTGGLTEANGASVLTVGGGVDIGLNSRVSLRTQTDFLRNRFFHQTGPDFRLATGPVFHFGRK